MRHSWHLKHHFIFIKNISQVYLVVTETTQSIALLKNIVNFCCQKFIKMKINQVYINSNNIYKIINIENIAIQQYLQNYWRRKQYNVVLHVFSLKWFNCTIHQGHLINTPSLIILIDKRINCFQCSANPQDLSYFFLLFFSLQERNILIIKNSVWIHIRR